MCLCLKWFHHNNYGIEIFISCNLLLLFALFLHLIIYIGCRFRYACCRLPNGYAGFVLPFVSLYRLCLHDGGCPIDVAYRLFYAAVVCIELAVFL